MNRKSPKILITGATGQLGSHIATSSLFSNILTPAHQTLNLCDDDSVKKYVQTHTFDAVIHTAAVARMLKGEKNPAEVMQTNIMGTCRLVGEIIKKEKKTKKTIRFIHISTDGVYPSIKGRYKETDAAIPYNNYGWTKLGAECAVNLLSNFCIVRTRFFDPQHVPFKTYATDSFSSIISLDELTEAINSLLYSNFIGTINIGGKRTSDYALYKKFKSNIKPCQLKDIQEKTPFTLSKDASMNCALWNKIANGR